MSQPESSSFRYMSAEADHGLSCLLAAHGGNRFVLALARAAFDISSGQESVYWVQADEVLA